MKNAILALLLIVFPRQFAWAEATYKVVNRDVQDGHMLRVTYVLSKKVSKENFQEDVYLVTKDENLEIHDTHGLVSAIPKREINEAGSSGGGNRPDRLKLLPVVRAS